MLWGIQKWIQMGILSSKNLVSNRENKIFYVVPYFSCLSIIVIFSFKDSTCSLQPFWELFLKQVSKHHSWPMTLPVLALKDLCPRNLLSPWQTGRVGHLCCFLQWVCSFPACWGVLSKFRKVFRFCRGTNFEKCSESITKWKALEPWSKGKNPG